ncbi:MAG: phosphotransferase family protein [Deltaproteobacteria bacterium]|nr:phosphotransferase family protein [Deltaproteobacteria bacterium]
MDLDRAQLAAWLARALPDFGSDFELLRFRGGQSNPTYWISDEERAVVLRKKPPGKLLPSAHDVLRERRVLEALAPTAVPVPRVLGAEEDPAILGSAFYVMQYVEGRIFRDVRLPEVEPEERAALYDELMRVLASVHAVRPAEVGLADYGRPTGYVARQVARWTRQYQSSRTADVPAMERLMAWLPEHLPADADAPVLAHGDFRVDNLVFHPSEPRCVALLDWELSTLGHPLADLGYVGMLYHVVLPRIGGLKGMDLAQAGIPTEASLIARYAELSGNEVRDLPFFEAFGLFRLASIAQGVYRRSLDGNASGVDAAMFGEAAGLLADVGCGLVGIRP